MNRNSNKNDQTRGDIMYEHRCNLIKINQSLILRKYKKKY